MRKDIHLHLDLSVPTRTLVFLMAAALLVTVTPELGSENVTLSTYYPAPSGVYTKMITTGSTFLATSGGSNYVGIGTTNPGVPLDITNTQTVGIRYVKTGSQDARIQVGDPTQTWSIASGWGGGTAGDFSIVQEGVSGNRLYISHTSGNVGIGTSNPSARFQVQGTQVISGSGALAFTPSAGNGYLYIDNTNTGCFAGSAAANGSPCTAGNYATWNPGVYVEGLSYNNRGFPANANIGGGNTTQVWAINTSNGKFGWGTLQTSSDGGGTVWCCPQ